MPATRQCPKNRKTPCSTLVDGGFSYIRLFGVSKPLLPPLLKPRLNVRRQFFTFFINKEHRMATTHDGWGRTQAPSYVPDPPMYLWEWRAVTSGLIIMLISLIGSVAGIAILGSSAWPPLLVTAVTVIELTWVFCRYRARENTFHDNREKQKHAQGP